MLWDIAKPDSTVSLSEAERLCNTKLKWAKMPKIGEGEDAGEKVNPVDPCVAGGVWGLQENEAMSLCFLPALCKPKCVFSVSLDGTLERTDDYLSGSVNTAEGFKKYPVWSCGKASISVKNKTPLSISSQWRVLGTSPVHLFHLWRERRSCGW